MPRKVKILIVAWLIIMVGWILTIIGNVNASGWEIIGIWDILPMALSAIVMAMLVITARKKPLDATLPSDDEDDDEGGMK